MSESKIEYNSHSAWHADAMQRESQLSDAEVQQRQSIADAHNASNGISDAETLADQQLYILGYMEIEEYQAYLLFKHSPKAGGEQDR